ncbi:unnamed protein product [Protopolystoma xenopodis]|uniref:Uncharacterized protein n=1 Tax=Protopolystoma xenopodis TaxID=117903 RepID=A0A448WS75_9PLAT|nr:unnamed protein product [Protopolystoma xenopodis]
MKVPREGNIGHPQTVCSLDLSQHKSISHATFSLDVTLLGVKNFIMANMTGRFLPGDVESFVLRAPNGTQLVQLKVQRTEGSQIYVSRHPMDPIHGHYYLQVISTLAKCTYSWHLSLPIRIQPSAQPCLSL